MPGHPGSCVPVDKILEQKQQKNVIVQNTLALIYQTNFETDAILTTTPMCDL